MVNQFLTDLQLVSSWTNFVLPLTDEDDPNLSFEEEQLDFPTRSPLQVLRQGHGPSVQPGRGGHSGRGGRGGAVGQGGQKRRHEGGVGRQPAHPGYYTAQGSQQFAPPPPGAYDPAHPGYGQVGEAGRPALGAQVPLGQGWQPGSSELLDMVVKAVARINEGGVAKKQKKDEVDNNSVEEPLVPVIIKGLDVEDDGVSKICWAIRSKLRPFTGSQEEFWDHQDQVAHPIRESFDTDFLRLDPVNSQVTLRDHDRGATRTIKQYLKQNIRVEKTKLVTDGTGYDANDVGFRREYVESTGVYQVVSGLWQYQTNLWMIRRDDHSGVLLLRMLHDVKFFLPTLLAKFADKNTRDKKQLEVVTYFVDECLRQNSQRGRQGRPPLNYDEVRRVAKSALHNIYSGSGVSLAGDFDLDACSFDPYTASASAGAGVDGMARSRNRNRNRGRGGGGASAGAGLTAGSAGASTTPGAVASTGGGPLPCRAWNAGTCTWVPCKFSHFCSKVLQGGGFCKKNHKVTDHK